MVMQGSSSGPASYQSSKSPFSCNSKLKHQTFPSPSPDETAPCQQPSTTPIRHGSCTRLSTMDEEEDMITLNISFRKAMHDLHFHKDATVVDLFDEIRVLFDVPQANQKIIVPKGPLLKSPPQDPSLALHTLQGKKLVLMGTEAPKLRSVESASSKMKQEDVKAQEKHQDSRLARTRERVRQRNVQKFGVRGTVNDLENNRYTFLQVKPLETLPNPERSLEMLLKLKQDRGIRLVMKRHKFTVALLTEMEPLTHTTVSHEGTSRTLGLNRNKGEVIELRLRTDAHDGYRDYRTVRKTLCHELAHNEYSNHHSKFWNLCRQLEREVDEADWDMNGRTVNGSAPPRRPPPSYDGDGDDDEDAGGWTGGEFVLGGISNIPTTGMSRRQILARAVVERQRKEEQSEQKADNGWRPCQKEPKE